MDKKTEQININIFLALLRVGLWANTTVHESWLEVYGSEQVDWNRIYELADEQSVIGLVTAGIDLYRLHNSSTSKAGNPSASFFVPEEVLFGMISDVQMIEQTNKDMNQFIANLVGKMRESDIYTVLVKGQGVAQCYERPLWRSCGDVDLFLSDDNYKRAKELLVPIASDVEKEYVREKHLGMTIDGYVVELHGTLRSGLSSRVEKGLDEIKKAVFYEGKVRSWANGNTQVFLINADEDAVYVFTHMLQHFFKKGLGLRQVCDWCRLLWSYRDSLNYGLLESRIKRMGLLSEWKAFGALAVEYLGMPMESMPLYSSEAKWKKKADKICSFILEVGNMGHNRDMSYFEKYPYLIRKICSMGRRCGDLIRHARIFPMDSLRFFLRIIINGLKSAARGE